MALSTHIRHLRAPFDAYAVDFFGRVWSFKRGAPRTLSPHLVYGGGHASTRRTAYERVALYANGAKRNVLIHVLVCLAFHGKPASPRLVVCHTDGDSLNNTASNLRWGTVAENVADRLRHGWTHSDREEAR